jgi:hypothetical protein
MWFCLVFSFSSNYVSYYVVCCHMHCGLQRTFNIHIYIWRNNFKIRSEKCIPIEYIHNFIHALWEFFISAWYRCLMDIGRSIGRLDCCWLDQHSHSWLQSRVRGPGFFLSYTYMCFEIGPPLRRGEISVFQCRSYVCCTVFSARVYSGCHGVQVTMDFVHLLSLHCIKSLLYKVYVRRFSVNGSLCSRLCLTLFNCSETAVSQLISRRPGRPKNQASYTSWAWLLIMKYHVHFDLHYLELLLPVSCDWYAVFQHHIIRSVLL